MRSIVPSLLIDAVRQDIDALPTLFAGSYRFGPLSCVAAIMALTARCLVDSYEEALDLVDEHWGQTLGWEHAPAKGGLTAARAKLGPEPMRELWQRQLRRATEIIDPVLHRLPEQRRYVAIDGSWMQTPESSGVRKRWEQGGRSCRTCPQVLLVAGIEITQRIPVAATVVGLGTGERAAARELLRELEPSDVLLFDRGYPGREFLGELVDGGFDFAVRMVVGAGGFPEVDEFWRSGADDAFVPIRISDQRVVPLRLVRRRFPKGRPKGDQTREPMVILTSLRDTDVYTHDTILDLYAARWEAETFFREAKVGLQIEAFHSTSPDGILQEIYAALAWLTIVALLEHTADHQLQDVRGEQAWNDPERYTINRAQLIRLVRRNAAAFLSPNPERAAAAATAIDIGIKALARRAQPRRPGRHFERYRKSPWGRFRSDKQKGKK